MDLAAAGERGLRAAGKRITPQRKLVLDILSGANGHLDANDIYELGRHRDASLSLSTVYRTLGALKAAGLVHELHLDTEHHHYEMESEDEHSHVVCLSCGRVIEIETAAFAAMAARAAEARGFEISSARVELTGYCADCRARAAV